MYQTLEIDLTTLGSNVPEGQPAMVLADDDVIAFTGDYTSNLANDVSAVYIDLDAPNGLVQAPRVTISIPNSPFAWPDTIYTAPGGTPSMAELIIYFFEPDPTTARLDDYVLRRQVNDAAPEVLARNLMKQGSTPFFRYFGKRRYTSQVSELDSVPDSDLPLFHSAEIHGSIADTAASARGDSIRAVRVSFRSTKGVISVTGKVAVSGVLRGRVTMAGTDDIILADDIVYATDPGAGLCQDMFGMFSGARVIVADNLMNAPVRPRTNWNHRTYDDTKDEFFHGVILALDIFTVQNYNAGSRNDESCEAKTWGRGCLYITGGIIQKTRGAVGTGAGTGYVKRYSYDSCAATEPPPYYPTTGHFAKGQYYQIDPVGFSVQSCSRTDHARVDPARSMVSR